MGFWNPPVESRVLNQCFVLGQLVQLLALVAKSGVNNVQHASVRGHRIGTSDPFRL